MSEKFLFLLSGGIDSSISALKIISEKRLDKRDYSFIFFDRRSKISGIKTQAAFKKEKKSAMSIANLFDKELTILKLPMDWYAEAKKRNSNAFPHGRNTLFLAASSSYAAINFPKSKCNIVVGFVEDEGEDATDEVVKKFNILIRFAFPLHNGGNDQFIKIIAPFSKKNKHDILKYAYKKGKIGQQIIKKSWSCYADGSEFDGKHCGSCVGCLKRKTGFRMMNIERDIEIMDPTHYFSCH